MNNLSPCSQMSSFGSEFVYTKSNNFTVAINFSVIKKASMQIRWDKNTLHIIMKELF